MIQKDNGGLLFSKEELASLSIPHKKDITTISRHELQKQKYNNLSLCCTQNDLNPYGIPVVKPYHGQIPQRFIPFSAANSCRDYSCGIHFYIDDYMFERIWRNPDRYIPPLQKYCCVIGPDFSQYVNMPAPLRLWNCYRNRLLTAYWQQQGINVIPNVTWSLPDSYDYSFTGMPKDSVIAINCTGIVQFDISKYFWNRGYNVGLERLEPRLIVRYGSVMANERKDISIYFENERLRYLKQRQTTEVRRI